MKATHRTPRKENPGAGGRGPSRQRAHAFMATKTKTQWANEALDGRARIAELEAALRGVVNTAHGAGSDHWAACDYARLILETTPTT